MRIHFYQIIFVILIFLFVYGDLLFVTKNINKLTKKITNIINHYLKKRKK